MTDDNKRDDQESKKLCNEELENEQLEDVCVGDFGDFDVVPSKPGPEGETVVETTRFEIPGKPSG